MFLVKINFFLSLKKIIKNKITLCSKHDFHENQDKDRLSRFFKV
jgi:hypothetical protein